MGPYPIVRTLSSTNPKTVPRPPRPKSAAGVLSGGGLISSDFLPRKESLPKK